VCEKKLSFQRLCNGLMVGKLCSVVAGNGVYLLPVGVNSTTELYSYLSSVKNFSHLYALGKHKFFI
jgi:hypothetical protein